eukprot:CAMPEP_0197440662 /NCGR_PEP_ID=MMETSP1175-20131217/7108_1 /TAXON_ID=1003142 /ORGANISM="Triceratium dubium, Strain CCMP147" /LENGTH=164 /DNA_ID=CAMNT_0042970809 /DNA_START=610 /DNA_END=1100 /DNA_ORIENTATION=+
MGNPTAAPFLLPPEFVSRVNWILSDPTLTSWTKTLKREPKGATDYLPHPPAPIIALGSPSLFIPRTLPPPPPPPPLPPDLRMPCRSLYVVRRPSVSLSGGFVTALKNSATTSTMPVNMFINILNGFLVRGRDPSPTLPSAFTYTMVVLAVAKFCCFSSSWASSR